jgi:Uma2 family endonuclease
MDKKNKFIVYENCGVKEYWIVDPDTKKATGYYNTSGKYELIAEEQEKISSRLLNTVFIF